MLGARPDDDKPGGRLASTTTTARNAKPPAGFPTGGLLDDAWQ